MSGLEYSVALETGEVIDVLELDPETCPALLDLEVLRSSMWLLRHCTRATRRVLEDAKGGWAGPLQEALGTPPAGCLLRMEKPVCAIIGECGIADEALCTTRNLKKGIGRFPVCWEADVPREGADLTYRVVHAWKEGRWVVIVSPP